MFKSHIIKIIFFGLILKLLYIGFSFAVETFTDDFTFSHDVSGVLDLFKRHDTYWYQSIHEDGYPQVNSKRDLGWHNKSEFQQSSWGFMPGYPLATKAVALLLNTSFDKASFLLSILFSLACFILFYWLACMWFDKGEYAFYSTLLFMCMPFQYYFSMIYTEALFCMLFMGSLIAAKKKNYLLLALLASMMAIVRINGLVMLLPIALFILEEEKLLNGLKFNKKIWTWNVLKKFSFILLPVLCLAGYSYYQYLNTGEPFAYSIALQGGWYRKMMFPLAGLFRSGDFVSQFNSWYAIMFMIIAVFAWKRFSLSFNLIIWLNILLPLSSGSTISMARYIIIIFPLFFIFGFWLKDVQWKIALIPLFLGLQLYTFYFWLISHSFSY